MKKVSIYRPPQQGDDFPTAGEFKCRFPEEMAIEWPDWTVKWKIYEVKDYQAEIDICRRREFLLAYHQQVCLGVLPQCPGMVCRLSVILEFNGCFLELR